MSVAASGTTYRASRFGRDAEALVSEVSAPNRDRIIASVCGDDGSGKSSLLDRMDAEYRAAGWTVRRSLVEPADGHATPSSAILIDDAETLSDATFAKLAVMIEQRDDDIIIVHGVRRHPSALRRLLDAVDRRRAPIALGTVRQDSLASHVHSLLGRAVAPSRLEALLQTTAGTPWLLARILGAIDPDADDLVSTSMVDELDRDLTEWDPPLRDVLTAIAVGFDPRGRMPRSLEHHSARMDELVSRSRHSGLIGADGRLLPLIARVLLQRTPTWSVRSLQHELVDAIADAGGSLDGVATDLARSGLTDPRVARALEQAGDRLLPTDPAAAEEHYRNAIAAGASELSLAARLAQTAAACGSLDVAARLVDGLLSTEGAPDSVRAADVAANVWAQRGMVARGADIYRWLGPEKIAGSAPRAAVAMFASGDLAGAENMLAAVSAGSPSMVNIATGLLAQGIRDSLDARTTRTLPALIHSADMMTAAGEVVMLPDSPAAIAAIVAVHTGDLSLADSILSSAIDGGHCGEAARPRLLLLRGWVAMHADRPQQARDAIETATAGAALSARDGLLLCALEVGLARRADDAHALVLAWQRARESIMHVTVDLYSLLAFGELMIAGARLRDADRLEFHRAEAWSLLKRLGDPPLWAVPLHWAAIQAAILADRPDEIGPHAAALVRAAPHSPMAAAFAGAGRAWITVLAKNFDVAAVETAARELAAAGMSWEGSRLAGHAAAHADDRKDLARLLACARDVHPVHSAESASVPATTGPIDRSSATPLRDQSGLSARERQVARLVLDGKTYWEIGESMFISPRTVEHHVARIRRRLGAENRSELLTRLRFALDS